MDKATKDALKKEIMMAETIVDRDRIILELVEQAEQRNQVIAQQQKKISDLETEGEKLDGDKEK